MARYEDLASLPRTIVIPEGKMARFSVGSLGVADVDDKNPGVGAHIEGMLECRGKEEDKALSQGYNSLRENGTFWVTSERMKSTIKKLTFVHKTANIIGLQIADLVAYPIACHILRPDVPNPAFDILRKNIYLSEGEELGLKVIK